jgi:hypothetical protein
MAIEAIKKIETFQATTPSVACHKRADCSGTKNNDSLLYSKNMERIPLNSL